MNTSPTVSSPLAMLLVNGVAVAEYQSGSCVAAEFTPRPFLHPIRTLGGVVVTDTEPPDHLWHLGAGFAIPDINGINLWGGPTFATPDGYRWRGDHGRITHVRFDRRAADGFIQRLRWLAPNGEELLTERRIVTADAHTATAWRLRLTTELTAARRVRLASPAANGRTGAGYGGFFWRLPRTAAPRVTTAIGIGETVHGTTSTWLEWDDTTAGFALRFETDESARDPWFVRLADYPGVGLALASPAALHLPVGETVCRSVTVTIADR
ncbi:MAG: PmoA family protein [Gordonia sp. (in: high G+C Gram-positive bacteria)]